VVTEGLMNRNWRVTTVTGVWAVKQVLDVDAAAARRQHRATAGVAGLGLPVPAPVTAGDDSVVVVDGAVYAVLPWVDGVHRRGSALAVAEASALGELLARLHSAFAEVMPPARDRLVVPVTDLATAHTKIDRYLGLIKKDRARRLDAMRRSREPDPRYPPEPEALEGLAADPPPHEGRSGAQPRPRPGGRPARLTALVQASRNGSL
jgi:Ser/Thr protein kinase RdoA (MazF antagonist)